MDQKNTVLEQEDRLAEELLETRWLTPQNAAFFSDDGAFVSLEYNGEVYQQVQFFRTFPFTAPEEYLSVRQEGENQKEIGIITRLDEFDEATVSLVRRQLNLRYFMPQIQKIHEIKEKYGYSYWFVTTDKGDCRFTADQNGIAKLSETRLIISDVDGNRFELCDITKLSAKELKMVDLYM